MLKKGEILHLTLHRKWFDLIASGDKKHEFRANTKYWRSRLINRDGTFRVFKEVWFTNGYSVIRPFLRIEFKGIVEMDCVVSSRIQHGELVDSCDFCIDLGKVLEVNYAGRGNKK